MDRISRCPMTAGRYADVDRTLVRVSARRSMTAPCRTARSDGPAGPDCSAAGGEGLRVEQLREAAGVGPCLGSHLLQLPMATGGLPGEPQLFRRRVVDERVV